jgi:hypothetical protein
MRPAPSSSSGTENTLLTATRSTPVPSTSAATADELPSVMNSWAEP